MTQEEFDALYPHGSQLRQEKIRELEHESLANVPVVVENPETVTVTGGTSDNPAGGSSIPEALWRAG